MVVFGILEVPQRKSHFVSVQLQGTQRFIAQMGFKRMTPVQAITIPLLLKQRDVAVEALLFLFVSACDGDFQVHCLLLKNVWLKNSILMLVLLVHFHEKTTGFSNGARPARAQGRPWPS